MTIHRRDFLSRMPLWAATAFHTGVPGPARRAPPSDRHQRIVRIVQEYSDQGVHRTGTVVDRNSAEWLANEVREAGLQPTLEPFSLQRVDPVIAALEAAGRRIEGLPLFDGTFTDQQGVSGRMGALQDDAPIGLAETPPNAAGSGALGDARRRSRHAAIVAIARGARPSAAPCPSNADAFERPFGPPVLQVGSEHAGWLQQLVSERTEVHVTTVVRRTPVEAFNVTATREGRDRMLRPLVVMTPRSGWYTCASERGGGLVCWLELMRALRDSRPAREVHFVASSGHELGHLGINAYVRRRPELVGRSVGWIHLGANIGAAVAKTQPGEGNTIQASDQEFEKLLESALTGAGVPVHGRTRRGTVPSGEAEIVHRGGGRYVSVIGRNALFHHPEDRGAEVVDAAATAAFADAFVTLTQSLAG